MASWIIFPVLPKRSGVFPSQVPPLRGAGFFFSTLTKLPGVLLTATSRPPLNANLYMPPASLRPTSPSLPFQSILYVPSLFFFSCRLTCLTKCLRAFLPYLTLPTSPAPSSNPWPFILPFLSHSFLRSLSPCPPCLSSQLPPWLWLWRWLWPYLELFLPTTTTTETEK